MPVPRLAFHRWLPLGGAGVAAGIAGIGLAGSCLHYAGWTNWGLGIATMVPNTAVGLIALAAGLAGHSLGGRRSARILGFGVVIFAAAILSQYLTGGDLGIDGMILPVAPGGSGRVSPNTGIALILLGLSLGVFIPKGRSRMTASGAFAGAALALALLALAGYATGLRPVARWGNSSGMSFPTATSLLFLAVGCLVALRAESRRWDFGPTLFLTGVMILLSSGFSAVVTGFDLLEGNREVRHTVDVRDRLRQLGQKVDEADRIERTHYNTGDDTYHERLQTAEKELWSEYSELNGLVSDNASQSLRARDLEGLLRRKVLQVDSLYTLGSLGEMTADVRKREVLVSLEAGDAVNEELDDMLAEERRLLDLRGAEAEKLSHESLGTVLLSTGLALALLIAALAAARRSSAQRRKAGEALVALNAELESRVARRTMELESANAGLREAEARMRFLADTMPYMVWTTNPEGTIQYYNQAWIDYTGLTPEETLFGGIARILHPDDLAAAQEAFRQARESGQPYARENRYFRAADQTYRWHQVRARPERGVDGRIVRWIGSSVDIHAQRQYAEELQHRVAEATEELRAILEGATHFIFSVDAEGLVRSWNAAAERTLGWPASETIGRPATLAWHDSGELADVHGSHVGVDIFLERVRQGGALEREWRLSRRDGSAFPAWLSVTPLHDEAGGFSGAAFIGHDLTERKRLEASLAEARDAAVEASRLKSEFLANMSHELRTPMNGIIGMSELLLEAPLAAEHREMSEMVLNSAEALLTIINDILDFSKIEAGRMQIDAQPFDLRRVVEDCALLLSPRAHEKEVELVIDYDASLPVVLVGDGGRIRQVVMNLAGNAVKFTQRGEVLIRVTLARMEEGDAVVHIEVHDTGEGIPLEAQGRLFEPFTQADAATTRRFGGTGLGLAISRQLVELMGGTIGFESREGVGSKFWFELALKPADRQPEEARRGDLVGRRFLVVDDNANNRKVIGAQLAAMGAEADCVPGAVGALEALDHRGPFEAVLVDWHMPDQDGLSLARELRATGRVGREGKGSRWLVLMSSAASHGHGAGEGVFDDVLGKPVRGGELRRCLQRLLKSPGDQSAPSLAGAVSREASANGGLYLLLGEDNLANQRVARLLLERLGHRVDVASDGEAVLQALADRRYDAVFMDCQMPVLDGYATTSRIRSGAIAGMDPRIPVIALTANAMESDRLHCLNAGMDDFVTKPVRIDDLRDVLARHGLDRER